MPFTRPINMKPAHRALPSTFSNGFQLASTRPPSACSLLHRCLLSTRLEIHFVELVLQLHQFSQFFECRNFAVSEAGIIEIRWPNSRLPGWLLWAALLQHD